MLPAQHRLRHRDDFGAAVRHGSRAGTRHLVLHWASTAPSGAVDPLDEDPRRAHPTRVGFVVSKAVGGAVVRHRTQRRLRHVARALLPDLPPRAGLLVVRALPAAAGASSEELARDVRRGLGRLGLLTGEQHRG